MKNNQLRQVVFPILAAFIWGTAFVAQDVCADAMGAFTFNGTRYYIAVLSLLVVLAVSSGFRKDRPQISPAEKKAQRRQLWLGGFCCDGHLHGRGKDIHTRCGDVHDTRPGGRLLRLLQGGGA